MKKVASLVMTFILVSMLWLNVIAEIAIIESPNINTIHMESKTLDEKWLYEQIEAAPENTYKDVMKAVYIISLMQYGPYTNYEDVPSHDLEIDSVTRWLELLSYEFKIQDTEFGARVIFSEQVYINFYLEKDVVKQIELVVSGILDTYASDLKIMVMVK